MNLEPIIPGLSFLKKECIQWNVSSSTVKKEHRMVLTIICPKQYNNCSVFLLLGLPLPVRGTSLKSVPFNTLITSLVSVFYTPNSLLAFCVGANHLGCKDWMGFRFKFAMQTCLLKMQVKIS